MAIGTIESKIEDVAVSHTFLESVTEAYSTDLATLVLWQSLSRNSVNQQVQKIFAEEFSRLKDESQTGQAGSLSNHNDYLVVFAPGWFYKSQPENGADFAKPRSVLANAGLKTALINVEENGTVERNAELITSELARLGQTRESIILVSASKAGPEVALALTRLQQAGASHNVKAWLNIGGVLHGSVLADTALTWPVCWYAKLFVVRGESFAGIESLTTKNSKERAEQNTLLPGITVVNYVGIPLSGQVSDRARLGYSLLRAKGPNDGLTLILDEIPANSITIADLGLDHFFGDPDIHYKTVALANTVIRLVEARTPSPDIVLQPVTQALRGSRLPNYDPKTAVSTKHQPAISTVSAGY